MARRSPTRPSLFARYRKAIAGLITPVVTYVVVKVFHGDDALARDLSGVATMAVVARVPNAF